MKKIWPIILFFILLFLMSYFSYIPLTIFNINLESLSIGIKILYNFFCDIGLIIVFYLIYRKDINNNFINYFKNFGKNFNNSFRIYLIGLFFMIASNTLIALFFSEASANNEEIVRSLLASYPYYMFFSVALYAPFIEEIIFRKSVYNIVIAFKDNKITKYIYILISGLIFALLHVVGLVNSTYDYLYIIPYLSLGVAFGYIYQKDKNIFSTIILHSLHNTVTILLYFIMGVVK